MSYRLIDSNAIAIKYPEVNEMPCVFANLPNGMNGQFIDAQPEPKDIDAREAVYNLAEKIGIHQLFALTVELRGEPIQPEPHEGHWILHESPDGGEQYECSRCGVLWEFTGGTSEDNEAYFCPKCGTKMKGEQDGH